MNATAVRRARPLLGTFVEIAADGLDAVRARRAIDAAFGEVASVHGLMSFHAAGSDLGRLHRASPGSYVEVDPRTREVLDCALRIAAASGGRFDPTVAARQVARGLLPRPESAFSPDPRACWHDIVLCGAQVVLARPLWIDLGGIAKGYAVDRAAAILLAAGATRVCVNAGGDLRVAGARAQTILLRTPAGVGGAALELADGAVATSGCAAFAPPHRVRGAHRLGERTVSVAAPTCMLADALTKVVLAGDAAVTRRVLARFGASALVQAPRHRPVAIGAAA